VRQDRAVAVEDQPAVGNDRDDGDAVVLGQGVVVVVAQHLQIEQAHQEDHEHAQHEAGGHRQAHLEVAQLLLMVAQLRAPCAAEHDGLGIPARGEAVEQPHVSA
jgi:hypothetical protein